MKTKHVKKVFDLFGKKTVETAKGILNARNKNSSGNLENSLGYRLSVNQGRLELRFLGAPYASVVDKGARGSKSGAKAPNSLLQALLISGLYVRASQQVEIVKVGS